MKNTIENNEKSIKRQKRTVKIINALSSLDNECLKMRDMTKLLSNQGDLETAKYTNDLKEQYYNLLYHTYRFLYKTGWMKATGFYIQEFTSIKSNKKISQPLYELIFEEYKFYTIKNISYKKFTDKDCLGKFNGLFEIRDKELFNCDEAVDILTDFTRCYYEKTTKKYRTPGQLYRALIKYYSIKDNK